MEAVDLEPGRRRAFVAAACTDAALAAEVLGMLDLAETPTGSLQAWTANPCAGGKAI